MQETLLEQKTVQEQLIHQKQPKLKALILAGGLGTKMRSIAIDVPKPLVPVIGIPFLEHQLRLLKANGISSAVLCVSFMADKIKSYFGTGKRVGMDISYSEEEVPLGTAGAIKRARNLVDDVFIVLNGDSYIDLDFQKIVFQHLSGNFLGTIVLTKSSDSQNYSPVKIDNEGKIIEFLEKRENLYSINNNVYVNAGVYVFSKKILDFIELDKNTSLEKEIFPRLAKDRMLQSYVHEGYFIDIGRPESYDKFKKDALGALLLYDHNTVRDAMYKITRNGIDIVLVVDEKKKLLGVVNDRIIKEFLMKGGSIESALRGMMIRDPIVCRTTDEEAKVNELLYYGIRFLPIVDESGIIKDIATQTEKIKKETFPVFRGKAPLRISFAGGGTDLPYFFEKYGGLVISATINKYCYATLIKRADRKIIIDSDATSNLDVLVEDIGQLKYNGQLDLVKAVINLMQPEFGFELYLYNDIPPGRGLGASASLAVLVTKVLNQVMNTNYDDYKIAEIAFKAETEELKIKGGWQDQYASVTGGFNYMEFNSDRTIIYPLRLKEEIIKELNSHLMLCYVGVSQQSGEIHTGIEKSFKENEEEKLMNLNKLKQITLEMKDSLLTGKLEDFGRLLRESWDCKRNMSKEITNPRIDYLYETGLKNGAFGGKLLGAGSRGYLLIFYSPRKRNQLKKSLEIAGGEIMDFDFEFRGVDIWNGKNRF